MSLVYEIVGNENELLLFQSVEKGVSLVEIKFDNINQVFKCYKLLERINWQFENNN